MLTSISGILIIQKNVFILPVAPVNRVLMSSLLLVKFVSHAAHAYNFVPLMWSKNMRPILICFFFSFRRFKFHFFIVSVNSNILLISFCGNSATLMLISIFSTLSKSSRLWLCHCTFYFVPKYYCFFLSSLHFVFNVIIVTCFCVRISGCMRVFVCAYTNTDVPTWMNVAISNVFVTNFFVSAVLCVSNMKLATVWTIRIEYMHTNDMEIPRLKWLKFTFSDRHWWFRR